MSGQGFQCTGSDHEQPLNKRGGQESASERGRPVFVVVRGRSTSFLSLSPSPAFQASLGSWPQSSSDSSCPRHCCLLPSQFFSSHLPLLRLCACFLITIRHKRCCFLNLSGVSRQGAACVDTLNILCEGTSWHSGCWALRSTPHTSVLWAQSVNSNAALKHKPRHVWRKS